MKLFTWGTDGGPDSIVTGYWLAEFKSVFSIVLLRFGNGSRDAFHSHAFNSASWLLSGRLFETMLDGSQKEYVSSFTPIITKRDTFHKVYSDGTSWVLSFRGPWVKQWKERLPNGDTVTLESGRKIVARQGDQS